MVLQYVVSNIKIQFSDFSDELMDKQIFMNFENK